MDGRVLMAALVAAFSRSIGSKDAGGAHLIIARAIDGQWSSKGLVERFGS